MRRAALACASLVSGLYLFSPAPLAAEDAHTLYTALLVDVVAADGLVDYRRLKTDPRLDRVIAQLEETNPDSIADADARLAFWLNVYNAYTLKLIRDHYPVESINDLHCLNSIYIGTVLGCVVWKTWEFPIYGKLYTLDFVEHAIIRPVFADFRVHAAMVCAAISCPPLRNEAYEGARLNAQLDDQMRRWLADPEKNRYDAAAHTLYISKIFDWFEGDFVNPSRTVLQALDSHLPAETRALLKENPAPVRIRFMYYDWALNQQP